MKTEEKYCFKCNKKKSIDDFYKHKTMADGHINKCKDCAKNDRKKRENKLSDDLDWVIKERNRGREKYHRLAYKSLYKPSSEKKKEIHRRYCQKFPEKYLASKYTEIFM